MNVRHTTTVGLMWLMLAMGFAGTPAGEVDDREGLEFFEKSIRPVLAEHCNACHSAQAAAEAKLRGELRLDTREGARQGGESGPAIVPGDVEASLLVSALRHESFEMPPKGKLPDTVIADFVRWIEMGAPDPRTSQVVRMRLPEPGATRVITLGAQPEGGGR